MRKDGDEERNREVQKKCQDLLDIFWRDMLSDGIDRNTLREREREREREKERERKRCKGNPIATGCKLSHCLIFIT